MTEIYSKDQVDAMGAKIGQAIKKAKGLVDTNSGSKLSFWLGTQAEYDLIVDKDPQTLYWVTYE